MIFGPEPGGDGLLDIVQGLFFVPALGDTAGEGRTLDHEPAVFVLFQGHMKNHGSAPLRDFLAIDVDIKGRSIIS